MKNQRFYYLMSGAILTLLVLFAAFAVFLPQVQARETTETLSSGTEITNAESINAPETASEMVVEETDSILNENNSVPTASGTTYSQDDPEINSTTTPLPSGTIEQPQTDNESIVKIVQELAQKQVDLLLGKPGWLHTQLYSIMSDEYFGSDSLTSPTGQAVLLPNPVTQDSWYFIDGTTHFQESLGRIMAEDGTVTQLSLYTQGRFVNLTLKEAGYSEADYLSFESQPELTLPTPMVAERLAATLTWQKTQVSMEAYIQNGQYTVIVRGILAEPFEDTTFMPGQLVTGDKVVYIFDLNTGHLLSEEMYRVIEGGTEVYMGRNDYLLTEYFSELPGDIAELFDNALNAAAEE